MTSASETWTEYRFFILCPFPVEGWSWMWQLHSWIEKRGTWRKGHQQKELCPHAPTLHPIRKCPSSFHVLFKPYLPVLRHVFACLIAMSIQQGQVYHMIMLSSLSPPWEVLDRSCVTGSPTPTGCTQAAGPPSRPSHTRQPHNKPVQFGPELISLLQWRGLIH